MYILCNVGLEAEFFLFQNLEIVKKIECCLDSNGDEHFHGISILPLEAAKQFQDKKIIVTGNWETFCKTKKRLEELGLREFEHFIWAKIFHKKIVLVNANCHGTAIINYLQLSNKFNQEYCIYPLSQIHLNEHKEIEEGLLNNIDIYLHQDIRANNKVGYKLSDEYVLPRLKPGCKSICIPNFVGMSHWMFPSLGGLDKVIHSASGPLYVLYRDKVLDEAVNQLCTTVEEYRKFWSEYVYTDELLDKYWHDDMEKIKKREENWDIKVTPFITENYKRVPCFVDANHPSKYLMREIGRQIANMLELDDIDDEMYESEMGIPVPIMPVVYQHFGLQFEDKIERKTFFAIDVDREMLISGYIKAYMWWYHELLV